VQDRRELSRNPTSARESDAAADLVLEERDGDARGCGQLADD